MEDSTATTIEFLRARLLAERSVSRTARQRAYELSKRVTELEKQLKFVSLQRKKAEKATVDVLDILENHDRSDLSETFDSSSDQEEISSDFKDGKQVETSEHVKVRESDTEGFSGSEVESSSVNGKSLSWKSSKNSSSRFLEKKYMDASRRRRSNSFTSTGSSPRRVGKSCRQIRRREHRSIADGSENDDASNAHCEDDGRTSSEGVPKSADVAIETSIEEPMTHDEKDPMTTSSGILENHGGAKTNGHIIKNHDAQEDMEKALEHQAKFIAGYEAEEKAQKEWEDKFRENNGSIPDSCDPGTHSDVTEERDEIKAPAPDKLTSETQEIDNGAVDANEPIEPIEPKTARAVEPSSHIETEPLPDQKTNGLTSGMPDNQYGLPDFQGAARNFSPGPSSGMSEERALGTHENTDKLGSVLEALQQAKLSLKQNLENFLLLESGPSIPTYRSGEKFPVPSISTGLFRLPTEYQLTSRTNSLTYDSRLSLTNYPTEQSSRFISNPYRESLSRSASSLDDRFCMVPTFPYQETSPGPPARDPRLDLGPFARDPRLDLGPPARDLRLDLGLFARDPRLDPGPPARDPRLDVGPSGLHPRLDSGPSALDPRLDVGLSGLDPRLGTGPSALDPRLGTGQSARDQRLDTGLFARDPRFDVGPSAHDPRSNVGPYALNPRFDVGLSARDPRFDVGPSARDPRLSVGPSARDPRSDMGPSAFDPRLGAGPSARDPRLSGQPPALYPRSDVGVGLSAFDPRLEMGSPLMGDRYMIDTPGAEIPLRTRSLYDDYTRPNTYG